MIFCWHDLCGTKILQDAANSRTYKETANDLHTSEAVVKNLACALFKEFHVCTKTGAADSSSDRYLCFLGEAARQMLH
jgi:hypothetical protein